MKILNLSKTLCAVGALSLILSSCNMEEHRKDREERTIEKETKRVERSGTDRGMQRTSEQ